MRKLFGAIVLVFIGMTAGVPVSAEIFWSQDQDFYLEPPIGWLFYEDPSPQSFLLRNSDGTDFIAISNNPNPQQPDPAKSVTEKAKTIIANAQGKGDGELFQWSGQEAWLGTITYKAGPYPVKAILLVTRNQGAYFSALAWTLEKNFDQELDVLQSTVNSLALGDVGRKDIGPLSAYYRQTGNANDLQSKALTGLPTAYTLTYAKDADEGVKAVMERESRLMQSYVQTRFLNPAWTRFYRQIYRELYSSLLPLSGYWKSLVRKGTLAASDLNQTMMTWVQKFGYSRKGGLTDLSTPWETLSTQTGDCDSRSLVFLALAEQTGTPGILMVSAKYSHAMAALGTDGTGARFPLGDKTWLVAEVTDSVNLPALGQIPQEYADPNQWLGIDLWGKP